MALFHHAAEQFLHGFDLAGQRLELAKFLAREFLPAFGSGSGVAETEKEVADFVESKAGLAGALHHREAVKDGGIVTALAADSLRREKNSNLFVVADGGRAESHLFRHFGNRQQGHWGILADVYFESEKLLPP